MVPRPRKRGNRDLPENLYVNAKGYYYRHPHTKKNHGMGTDRARAIKAAKAINQRLASADNSSLVAKVLGYSRVADGIARFRSEYLVERKLAKSTAAEVEYRLKRYERELGEISIQQLDLQRLSDWLKKLTREAYRKHRNQWIEIFRFWCSVGLVDRNLAELTLPKEAAEKVRERWTLEQYRLVRPHAEPWLQDAMDLAITSLQRREDLVNIRKREDFENDRLLIRQRKTGQRIAITPAGTLKAVIATARNRYPFCPYLIGRKPERDIRGQKTHPYQITPGFLTKAVAAARDASGVFDGVPKEKRPTLHEFRSLGAHLYREAGYPEEYIQALLGHADVAMTKHYLDGHKIEWNEVKADLVVGLE